MAQSKLWKKEKATSKGTIRQNRFRRAFKTSDPDVAKQILRANDNYEISNIVQIMMRGLFGSSILSATGEDWEKLRRIHTDIFANRNMETIFNPAVKGELSSLYNELVNHAEQQEAVSILQITESFSLGVIGRSINGNKNALNQSDIEALIENAFSGKRLPKTQFVNFFAYLQGLPLPFNVQSQKKSPQEINGEPNKLLEEIRKRRNSDQRFDDILQILVDYEDPETAENLEEEHIFDISLGLIGAGFFTTQSAIAFCVSEILKHPDVTEKVIVEAKSTNLENIDSSTENTHPYISKCVKETLRLHSPIQTISRQPNVSKCPFNHEVKKGMEIDIFLPDIHKNENHHDSPNTFDPDRFEEKMKPTEYMPFGYGPRACIGRRLAMLEAVQFVAMLFREFDVELKQDFEGEKSSHLFMMPDGECLVNVRKCDGPAV